jgi:hypothetical protein
VYPDAQLEKQFKALRIVAWAMLVAAPVVYLFAANLISAGMEARAGNELILYLLLVVALVIEWTQVQSYRARPQTEMKPINLFFTLSVMKMAMVEAVYIFGFVVFVLTGRFLNMLFFYPIGVAWTLVLWPKQEKYDQLMEKLNRP